MLPLLLLLAVYSIVAFTNLGSNQAPQSFFKFTEDRGVVELDLGERKNVSQILYYTGLYPGDYDLYYSGNGSNWSLLRNDEGDNDAAMPQSYADLFKWQYAKMDKALIQARYFRVVARALPMELGEMAFYDEGGERIDVTGVDSVLLDEH